MILKQLDSINLAALYERQAPIMRCIPNLKEGMRLDSALSFIFPFTHEDGNNIYESKGLHVFFIEITDNNNVINPTLSQGILNLKDGEQYFNIERIYNKQNIPLKTVKEIINPQLKQLLNFRENANGEVIQVVVFLAKNTQLLKKSICEFFEV